jgi:hypothetical protein
MKIVSSSSRQICEKKLPMDVEILTYSRKILPASLDPFLVNYCLNILILRHLGI